ncbi:MAG: PucR family transcriptional regulator ligand-binding domain-containing protein [Anaerolineae bacterium]|nr:PucR family transcriptional regulator ligand-binding domain-containing protein [Anaerolineae bacterium]
MSAVSTSADIRSLLKLALPIGSRLITGHPDTPVTWVCNLRTRPPIFADIEGGELVMLSTATLSNYQKPLTLETVIEELTATRASALAVRGTVMPRAHQVARAANFPVIVLPDRAALPQVERAVQRLLTHYQAQLAHRAFELQQTLQRHAASHRGLTTMLNALARMLDRPVVIHDRAGEVLSRGLPASHGHDWDSHLALVGGAEFVRRFDIEDRAFFEDDWRIIESPAGITAPLIHERQLLGYVSILSAGDAPDRFDLLTLEHSAPVFVREMVHQQTTTLTHESAPPVRDWLSDWLHGTGSDDTLLTLRAEKDCYQADAWHAVVLFHWLPANDRAAGTFSPERMVSLIPGRDPPAPDSGTRRAVRRSRRDVVPARRAAADPAPETNRRPAA